MTARKPTDQLQRKRYARRIPSRELPGRRYASLTILEVLPGTGQRRVRCQCDCGKEWTGPATSLLRGNTRSCGCRQGGARPKTWHGRTGHPIYHVWVGMRGRCNNPNNQKYPDYGGRGITVDPRWDDFATFLVDMGERPPGTSLDRIDNDGPYSPENCRWATPQAQRANQRTAVGILDLLAAGVVTREQIDYVRALKAAA